VTRNDILDHCVAELRVLGEADMAEAIEALKERKSVSDEHRTLTAAEAHAMVEASRASGAHVSTFPDPVSDSGLGREIEALVAKWRREADETDAAGDYCCALTQRDDADDLAALLRARSPQPPSQEELPADAAKVLRDNLWELYDGAPVGRSPQPPEGHTLCERIDHQHTPEQGCWIPRPKGYALIPLAEVARSRSRRSRRRR
jgi:hypothetical protein